MLLLVLLFSIAPQCQDEAPAKKLKADRMNRLAGMVRFFGLYGFAAVAL